MPPDNDSLELLPSPDLLWSAGPEAFVKYCAFEVFPQYAFLARDKLVVARSQRLVDQGLCLREETFREFYGLVCEKIRGQADALMAAGPHRARGSKVNAKARPRVWPRRVHVTTLPVRKEERT